MLISNVKLLSFRFLTLFNAQIIREKVILIVLGDIRLLLYSDRVLFFYPDNPTCALGIQEILRALSSNNKSLQESGNGNRIAFELFVLEKILTYICDSFGRQEELFKSNV